MALSQQSRRALKKEIPILLKKDIEKIVKKAFQKKKNEMIAEFLNHPVTLEIKGGVNASNISGTLSGLTNLFSFIGFESSEDPIKPIIDKLQETRVVFNGFQGNRIVFNAEIPNAEEIFKLTPLPYMSGRSWAKSIETGLSGLGYYLKRKSTKSRSGLGIQAQKPVRSVKFKNTKYISAFLKKYRKEFNNLEI
jgi:hypothetical protein